jgi:hypothetical protein
MVVNLLKETESVLEEHGKTLEDIKWVSSCGDLIPVDLFLIQADRCYDNGYGGVEVDVSLIVSGDDWWLERREYDGSEWWVFRTAPVKPNTPERYDLNIFYLEEEEC